MRRGAELREHILLVAKDVFIEMGYERASMDVVAARASTSKRSLYAHFETKERLFLAVIDLVHDLFVERVKGPGDYADDTVEAITRYCARVQQLLRYGSILRTCRIAAAEAEHLPEAATRYFETFFGTPRRRLTEYLVERLGMKGAAAARLSDELLAQAVFPRFEQALFGVEALLDEMPDASDIPRLTDLAPIRRAVVRALDDEPPAPVAATVRRRARSGT
jgi:AcrR family transcriptional regulator